MHLRFYFLGSHGCILFASSYQVSARHIQEAVKIEFEKTLDFKLQSTWAENGSFLRLINRKSWRESEHIFSVFFRIWQNWFIPLCNNSFIVKKIFFVSFYITEIVYDAKDCSNSLSTFCIHGQLFIFWLLLHLWHFEFSVSSPPIYVPPVMFNEIQLAIRLEI